MSAYRIALDPKNHAELAKSAKQNGRSLVRELNVILQAHFDQRRESNAALAAERFRERAIADGITAHLAHD